MKLKIQVTQEDIDKGTPGDGSSCPIARACQRLGYGRVWAGTTFIEMRCTESQKDYRAKTPDAAIQFMTKFDMQRLTVAPWEFEIEADQIEKGESITL